MAKFYNISPQEVEEEWYHLDYLPRAEYMHVQGEVDAQYQLYKQNQVT